MSTIVFVRHAQASLFETDYDRLSELGHRQARQLSQFLTRQHRTFQGVYTGPRLRHRQTASPLLSDRGQTDAAVTELAEFDENQVERLVTDHLESITAEFPPIKRLNDGFRSAADPAGRQHAFSKLYAAVARLWASDDCRRSDVETVHAFRARVNLGIDRIVNESDYEHNVMVFTSVGPIVVAMQRALSCADHVAMRLGWRIRNCSLTEFVLLGEHFSLDSFNTMSHLGDPGDWTYW